MPLRRKLEAVSHVVQVDTEVQVRQPAIALLQVKQAPAIEEA